MEGILRELVRFVNGLRKKSGLTIENKINIYWEGEDGLTKKALNKFKKELLKDTLAKEIFNQKQDLPENQSKIVQINNNDLWLGIEKIS